ncbi:hypothetical protein [Okeania sp. SIO1I7]|uniref:hypothetical protein n=1 Tax=Okeania sp. SIO1I7 TaxID=2607772 RepID=UPI0025E07DF4|nr:hypothetical protein [Okeania sp. SIO1I7]
MAWTQKSCEVTVPEQCAEVLDKGDVLWVNFGEDVVQAKMMSINVSANDAVLCYPVVSDCVELRANRQMIDLVRDPENVSIIENSSVKVETPVEIRIVGYGAK